jgi:hypothetical protein
MVEKNTEGTKEKLVDETARLSEREIDAALDRLADAVSDVLLASVLAMQEKKRNHLPEKKLINKLI